MLIIDIAVSSKKTCNDQLRKNTHILWLNCGYTFGLENCNHEKKESCGRVMWRKQALSTILLINLTIILISLSGIPFKVQRVKARGTIIAIIKSETGDNEFTFLQETPVNSTFIANVTVMDVSYLAGWQVNITWDPTLLRINSARDVSIPSDNVFGDYAFPLGLKITHSSVFWLAVILNAPTNHVNVTSGTLYQVRFTIITNDTSARGSLSCDLHFVVEGEYSNHTILGDSDAEVIPYTPLDCMYEMFKHPYHESILTLIINDNMPTKPYWNDLIPTNYTFIVHNGPDSRGEIFRVVISQEGFGDVFNPDSFYQPPGWTAVYESMLKRITFESIDPPNTCIPPGEYLNFTIYFTDFPDVEAKYKFTVSTIDIYKDLDVHYMDFYVDIRAPIITLVFPTEDGHFFRSGEDVWINATVQDDERSPYPSGTQGVHAVIEDQDYPMMYDPVSNIWFARTLAICGNTKISGLSDGEYTVKVYASDTARNIGCSDIVYFTVDTMPPEIEIVSPQNTTHSASSVSLSFTVSEPTSWVGYSLDRQMNVTITGNETLSEIYDGKHSVIVYAKDAAGNVGSSETIYFTVNAQKAEPSRTWIVASIAIIALVGAVLLVYFTKFKKSDEK